MSDPIGLIGAGGGAPVQREGAPIGPRRPEEGAPSFKDVLLKNLDDANKLQQDANRAVEDLLAGERDDVESVLLATQKADTAFRALQAVRNKVVEAYQEIQRMPI
jgi:flagellar hook-basal body complex protein FliE